MNLTRWRTFALWLIAALVTMASLAAFAQSYRGLYDWAREHGLSGFWAAAWPVQLDVFIAVGELALFVALVDKWPRRARVGAWTVTLIGAAVSVAGNVGHVASHDIASRLTAAVPPVAAASALFVALTILKWVTRPAKPATVASDALPLVARASGSQLREVTPEPVPVVAESVTLKPLKPVTLTVAQQAKRAGVSERTMYRRLAMANGNGSGHAGR